MIEKSLETVRYFNKVRMLKINVCIQKVAYPKYSLRFHSLAKSEYVWQYKLGILVL